MNETQRKAARAAIAEADIDTSTLKGQRQAFGIAHEHEVAATHRTTVNTKARNSAPPSNRKRKAKK